jgi:radical SAM protein with 4Fe4S-binding SPASM domain
MNQTPGAREKRLMPLELFKKIIDDAVDIQLIDHVTLTGLGETLLDRLLDVRLAYTREKMPRVLLDIYTNGSQLTKDRGLRLADAGIDVIYVSLNAADREKRLQIMKLDDYDKVVSNLHELIGALKTHPRKPKVIVKSVVSKDLMEQEDLEKFLDEWGGPHDKGGHAFLHHEGNWAGVMYPMRVKPVKPCGRALNEIMVLSDGRVSACCFDGFGEKILGDLKTQTLREMYSSPTALEFRLAHAEGRRQEIPICANCTSI